MNGKQRVQNLSFWPWGSGYGKRVHLKGKLPPSLSPFLPPSLPSLLPLSLCLSLSPNLSQSFVLSFLSSQIQSICLSKSVGNDKIEKQLITSRNTVSTGTDDKYCEKGKQVISFHKLEKLDAVQHSIFLTNSTIILFVPLILYIT